MWWLSWIQVENGGTEISIIYIEVDSRDLVISNTRTLEVEYKLNIDT